MSGRAKATTASRDERALAAIGHFSGMEPVIGPMVRRSPISLCTTTQMPERSADSSFTTTGAQARGRCLRSPSSASTRHASSYIVKSRNICSFSRESARARLHHLVAVRDGLTGNLIQLQARSARRTATSSRLGPRAVVTRSA